MPKLTQEVLAPYLPENVNESEIRDLIDALIGPRDCMKVKHIKLCSYVSTKLFYKNYYHPAREQTIESGFLGAAQYLSFVAYPFDQFNIARGTKDKETIKRKQFFQACIWLYLREYPTPSEERADMISLSKQIQKKYGGPKKTQTAHSHFNAGKKKIFNRFLSWQAYNLSCHQDQPLKSNTGDKMTSIKSLAKAYPDKNISENFFKDIFTPSKPTLHLVEGIIETVGYSRFNIYKLLMTPNWVEKALHIALQRQETMMLDNFLAAHGTKGTRLQFKPESTMILRPINTY